MRIDLEHHLSRAGRDPFQRWLDGLADLRCRVAILRRVDRMASGNPGDHRIPLLCGGSKRSQAADIATAVENWADYQERQ